jgi:hypothetical protein
MLSLLRHAAVCVVLLHWAGAAGAEERASDAGLCHAAAAEAETRFGLPAGLLGAIGRVESGSWPWTINAAGTGRTFRTAADAIENAELLRRAGTMSIDVGCFQISLLYHPAAFSSLEQAFEPNANADYAARFLTALRNRLGTWGAAVAAYHSATPDRGLPYRDRVLGTWTGGLQQQGPRVNRAVLNVVTWTAAQAANMRVWTPSPMGSGAHVIAITSAR